MVQARVISQSTDRHWQQYWRYTDDRWDDGLAAIVMGDVPDRAQSSQWGRVHGAGHIHQGWPRTVHDGQQEAQEGPLWEGDGAATVMLRMGTDRDPWQWEQHSRVRGLDPRARTPDGDPGRSIRPYSHDVHRPGFGCSAHWQRQTTTKAAEVARKNNPGVDCHRGQVRMAV